MGQLDEKPNKAVVMDIADVGEAIAWQAEHLIRANAPCNARVVRALIAVLETDTAFARRMKSWAGLTLRDAMPLRAAGGLHHLLLSGEDRRLEAVYVGITTDQSTVDGIVCDLAKKYDTLLLPWLDGPPQTNEAGRSASVMAGLLWLSERVGSKFALNEIGASAGINTMMDRYAYDLGGTLAGSRGSQMQIKPEWRGDAPPSNPVQIAGVKGCDINPVDLSDPIQALRLKAYIWPDARIRMSRMDAAIALAAENRPDLVKQDAAEFVREMLEGDQECGVTRVLFHTVMWQYMPQQTTEAITEMMEQAGKAATAQKPLAWVSVETNRATYNHELKIRYWNGSKGDGETHLLAQAHPHGAWVEWFGSN